MRISTTCRNRIIRVLAVAFWIAVWQGVSLAVGSEILVASPARTFGALLSLLREGAFYRAVLGSLMRICAGFALALALGIALGALSFVVGWVRALLHPVVSVVKATPVASFVILALIWISSKNLSIFISFLMVFPINGAGIPPFAHGAHSGHLFARGLSIFAVGSAAFAGHVLEIGHRGGSHRPAPAVHRRRTEPGQAVFQHAGFVRLDGDHHRRERGVRAAGAVRHPRADAEVGTCLKPFR